jgi:Holliday junction resolvase RusA-like endonuclease
MDALKGIVWTDDVQVVDGRAVKLYAENPRLRVEISQIEVFESEQRD